MAVTNGMVLFLLFLQKQSPKKCMGKARYGKNPGSTSLKSAHPRCSVPDLPYIYLYGPHTFWVRSRIGPETFFQKKKKKQYTEQSCLIEFSRFGSVDPLQKKTRGAYIRGGVPSDVW
jgi:hypothetical protein